MTKLPTQTRKVYLKHIDLDARLQPRDGINEKVVSRLMEAIENGVKLPPASIFSIGDKNKLAGGRHRYEAHSRLGLKHLECDIYEGTFEDAWIFSRGDNNHGENLSNAEKNRAVREMLERPDVFQWSDRAIAAHVGVGAPLVSKIRKELTVIGLQSDVRVGRDGRAISTTNIGASKPPVQTDPEPDDDELGDDPFADKVEEENTRIHLEGNQEAKAAEALLNAEKAVDAESYFPDTDGLKSQEEQIADAQTESLDSEPTSKPATEPTKDEGPQELTIEEQVEALPLLQALSLYKHGGYLFRQQATIFLTFEGATGKWKRKVQGEIRHSKGPVSEAFKSVCNMGHPSTWEGCPACKGSLRFSERMDPCHACNGVGFTTRKDEGVSVDVVTAHAESLRE